jgi:uncharacterized membrane protein
VEIHDGRRTAYGVPALERVVFFSDAVFAIAITLLAIDVRLPELATGQTNDTLLDALGHVRPALFAFVLSFGVIAAFWVGHYRTFRVVTAVDGRLITVNLVFLFFIAALPFPTSVLAGQGDLAVAEILYATFGILTGAASTVLWLYVVRARLVAPTVTPRIVRFVTYRSVVVPIMFAISIPIALIDPTVVWLWWIAIFPLQSLISRRFDVHHPAEDPDPPAAET